MRDTHVINLTQDAYEELQALSETLGFPPELAAVYAIRLVGACYREGLITDPPGRAWPAQARRESVLEELESGSCARVLDFPGGKGQKLKRRTGDGQ